MKLVFAFRPLLFDVEKGACFLVFEPPFSTSKTSFGFRLHFLYRLVGEHCVEKQKRFLVFGFRRPDWTDLRPVTIENRKVGNSDFFPTSRLPNSFSVTIGNVKSDIGNSKFEIILIASVHVQITSEGSVSKRSHQIVITVSFNTNLDSHLRSFFRRWKLSPHVSLFISYVSQREGF